MELSEDDVISIIQRPGLIKLLQIDGLLPTVTTVPVDPPRKFSEQLRLYVDSITAPTTYQLYFYVSAVNSWRSVSLSTGGITALTGDVTATGPGSGAATIANNAVTSAKINAGAVTEGKLGLSDVTTANVSTSAHGFTPKLPNDATKYLDGTGSYSTPTGNPGLNWTDEGSVTWSSDATDKTITLANSNRHLYKLFIVLYSGGSASAVNLQFNGDSNTHYAYTSSSGSGVSNSTAQTSIRLTDGNSRLGIGEINIAGPAIFNDQPSVSGTFTGNVTANNFIGGNYQSVVSSLTSIKVLVKERHVQDGLMLIH